MNQDLIVPANVSADPILGFYQIWLNYGTKIINKVIDENVDKYKIDENALEKHQQEKQDLEQEIQNQRKAEKINQRRFANVVIIISSLLIIGLFFLSFYFANKKIIKNFRTFEAEKNQLINKTKVAINKLIARNFFPLKTAKLMTDVFNQFGLKTIDKVNTQWLLKNFNNKKIIDILAAYLLLYKNTPIYDLVVRELNWKVVTTSASRSFSYTEYDGQKYVTKSVHLTAYHHEDTPFIEKKYIVALLTNFLENKLTLSSSLKSRPKTKLENSTFNKNFKFSWTGDETSLRQFFTIKTQEDFLRWAEIDNLKTRSFDFANKIFIVFKEQPLLISSYHESILFSLGLTNLHQYSINDIKLKIENLFKEYFQEWFKAAQLPLLVPGINREWYRHNKTYMIANSGEKQENENDFSFDYLINQNLDLFSFLNFNTARPHWLNLNSEPEYLDNLQTFKATLMLNSFRSEWLTDSVSVYDARVGSVYIDVKFEKFYPIIEPKLVYKFNLNLEKLNLKIMLAQTDKYQDIDLYNEDLRPLFEKQIWSSDPFLINKSLQHQTIIKRLNLFLTQNLEFPKYASLIISDEFGGLILVNNPQIWFQNDWESKILNLINDLKLENL